MPRPINGTTIAAKWNKAMGNARVAYEEGVAAVTVAPTQLAIAQIPKMARNFQAAIDDKKVERGLARVDLATWKQLTKTKGGQNLAGGAAAAQNKVKAWYDQAGPEMEALRARVRNMSNQTEQDMEARQLEWSRGMKEIAKNRRS